MVRSWQERAREVTAALHGRSPEAATRWRELRAEVHAWLAERGGAEARDAQGALYLLDREGALLLAGEELPSGLDRVALLREAVTAAGQSGATSFAADASRELAKALVNVPALAEAKAVLEHALTLDDIALLRPGLMLTLAAVERERGSIARAEQLLDRTAELLTTMTDTDMRASAHVREARLKVHEERGRLYLKLGLLDQAHIELRRQLELAVTEAPDFQASARIALMDLYLAMHDADRAAAVGAELLAPGRLRDARWIAAVKHRCAVVGFHRANLLGDGFEPALEDLRSAGADRDLGQHSRYEAMLFQARACLELGLWSEVAELDAGLRRLPRTGTNLLLQGRAAVVAARLALATRGDHATPADGAGLAPLRDRLAEVLGALLREWDDVRERAGGLGFLHYPWRTELLETLVACELELGDPRRPEAGMRAALEHVLAAQRRHSLVRGHEPRGVTLDRMLAGLAADGEGILLYLPAVRRMHVFALDQRRLVHAFVSLPKAAHLLAHEYRELLVPPRGDAAPTDVRRIRASGLRLKELLLPPAIAARVGTWRSVRIVGQDLLGSPPLECLPWGESSWLGLDKALSHLPSLPVGWWLRQRSERQAQSRPARPPRYALLAAPEHDPALDARLGLPPITLAAGELTRLARHFAAPPPPVVGKAATADALRQLAEGESSILHVIAHGLLDLERERWPTLLLTPEPGRSGSVDSLLVESFRGCAPLVVLTSCRTGRGPLRRGDDAVSHLGGSFLRAGAATVLLSSFDQDLDASVLLMDRFFGYLIGSGDRPSEALRRARCDLARSGPHGHPSWFGLLSVLGLDAPVPR